jgi:Protein of unknown function (DUF935)
VGLRDRIAALLGISAYQPTRGYGPELDDKTVEEIREALGGQLQAPPTTRLRWYIADLDTAQYNADQGNLTLAAQLCRAMRRDGVLAGLLGARTAGVVRLPKRFYGNPEIAEVLRKNNGSRSVFDEMFPPSELALLCGDGIQLGVGIAELVPVEGRDYPVMVRLDPEYLQYIWVENRWYFRSVAGRLPITPGDGRWVLHTPGGRLSPWNWGQWAATGRSYINKEHAMLRRSNFSATLANPARVAYSPQAATERIRDALLRKIISWGTNTAFVLPPGYEAKILETTGRGWEIFQKEIETCDREYMIALNGQELTTTGGSGFQNSEFPANVRADLVQDTGESLAYTINTQGLPTFIATRWGDDALENPTIVEWLTERPKDKEAEARTLAGVGAAIKQVNEALAPYDRQLDVNELGVRYGIPLARLNEAATPEGQARALSVIGDKSAPDDQREAA